MEELANRILSLSGKGIHTFNLLIPNRYGDMILATGFALGTVEDPTIVSQLRVDLEDIEYQEDYEKIFYAVTATNPDILIGTRGSNKGRPVRGGK